MDPKSDIVAQSNGLIAGLIALATTIAVTIGGALRFSARIADLEKKKGVSEADLDELRDKCADEIKSIREELRVALESAARRSRPMIEDDTPIKRKLASFEQRLTELHHQVIAIVAVMRGKDALGPPPTSRRR